MFTEFRVYGKESINSPHCARCSLLFGVPWCIIFLSVSGIVVVEEKFTQSFDEDT